MYCLMALAFGLLFAVPDILEYTKNVPEWFQNPNRFVWLRLLEALVALPFALRTSCHPLLLFLCIAGPSFTVRAATAMANTGGAYNMTPVGIALDLFFSIPTLLVCLIAGYWARSLK